MNESIFTYTPSEVLLRRARKLADSLTSKFHPYPKGLKGRGIVTCGGGYTYFTNAWVLIRMLRHLGCKLPIQLWHLGPHEVTSQMAKSVKDYGVECIDGGLELSKYPLLKSGKIKAGWVLKSLAIARCPFEEVMFLDSDNLPIRNPEFLFNQRQYIATGSIFWPDSSVFANKSVWSVFGVPPKDEPEFESGQIVVDKRMNWEALTLALELNLRADVFYQLMWGDKDTFRFAWHKLGRAFAIPNYPPQALQAAGSNADMLCQHDFEGNRLFQHRILYKWRLYGENPWVPGFLFENECRGFLSDLRGLWDGRCQNRFSGWRFLPADVQAKLFETTWLLEKPKPARKNGSSSKKEKLPTDQSKKWIEVRFERNGVFGYYTSPAVGTFWDLTDSGSGLTFSDGRGDKIKLRREGETWRGYWQGDLKNGVSTMKDVRDVYSHLKPREQSTDTSSVARELRLRFNDRVHIGHSGTGIGDHIVGAYACTALARMGIPVVYHSVHAAWMGRIKEPGLVITSQSAPRLDHNILYDFTHEMRYATSRAEWYAGGIHPSLKPAKPTVDQTLKVKRVPFERYMLLSPIATRSSREWLDAHWTRLTHLIRDAGYEVVVIGGKNDEKRLEHIFSSTQAYWSVNHSPSWVAEVMLGAAAYIGLDSGMTHFASLLNVNAVAIHSQHQNQFLWHDDSVQSVNPDARCVFCRWQSDRGWVNTCEKTCSALASISPERVLEATLKVAEQRPIGSRLQTSSEKASTSHYNARSLRSNSK